MSKKKTGPEASDKNPKSEEVQAIIDRMPTYWAKWISLCVGIFIGVVILLGFVIKYPDTVDGQITITGNVAPVRLVANSPGRIQLLQPGGAMLSKGDVISYLESGADYRDILYIDSALADHNAMEGADFPLPDTLLLGDVSSAYNRFYLSYMQYRRVLSSDVYSTIRRNLEHKIASDEVVIANMDEELRLKETILRDARELLDKDSILLVHKAISEQEYKQKLAEYLALNESRLSLRSSRMLKSSEINSNRIEIQRTLLEENDACQSAYSESITGRNELENSLSLWKERYLQVSPIDGELEYMGFWRDNSFVQAGQELFSVIPDRGDIIGEVMIPSFGAGKVAVGQTANVKINNYPYDEYGLLRGEVSSISRITNKVQTADGTTDTYLVTVAFPEGTVTNFGRELSLEFETKGTVEIVTKRKRLIERLFDNLKSRGEK